MKYPNILPLQGVIQHYDWGGFDYIPQLTGKMNPGKIPQAELWMGTHSRGPAMVGINDQLIPLDEWIDTDPEGILGGATAAEFHNRLPFLFKILDVRKMLSIQAHPTKKAAEAGFRRENELVIPLSARHRNYKDDNHKPEIMVALGDFWLLHGFKAPSDIPQQLEEVPELAPLQAVFEKGGIRGLYQYLMELPQRSVDQVLAPMAARLEKALDRGDLDRNMPDYWAAQAFRDYTADGHYDRGIFSIYLFNLVHLKEGEGIFQDANIPHAYLEGVNVELMANSDNVFRGGLTSKHVDVAELMQHLHFEGVDPQILKGQRRLKGEWVFSTPVPDFELSMIRLSKGDTFLHQHQEGPAIFIVLLGEVSSQIGELSKGAIFFSPHGAMIHLAGFQDSVIFRAGVPG